MRFLAAKQDLGDHRTIPSPGGSLAASPGRHPRPIPLFAPTIYMLFRPEQKHGLSGKDNVLVPIAGRNGYMN